jgi:phage protein D
VKNTLPVTDALRQPRGIVKVNGNLITGWLRFDADANVFHDPDKASITFAVRALPAAYGVDWWTATDNTDFTLELFAGFPADPNSFSAGDLDSIFVGKVDEATVDWADGTLDVTCRDLSAPLLDNKASEKFVNQTASQVATKLASKYGLTANVTATTGKVGRFYARDHIDLQSDRTEWDLLTWLARQEGFVAYVKGRALYFGPPTHDPDPYVIHYQQPSDTSGSPQINAASLKTTRVLTVARDISVVVSSYVHGDKKAYSRKAVRNKGHSKEVQVYSVTIPGLSPEQCQKKANELLAELSRHERRLEMSGPADNTLSVGQIIRLTGTGTDADQDYFPDSIHRQMELDNGYSWTVSAKNHSPETQVTV